MTAFRTILMWEIRTEMRRVSTWVYFGIYFGLAFFSILAAGGAFDRLFGIGGAGRMLVNSPYALSAFIPVLALLGLSITAAMAGNALYRDYEAGIEPLVYTTPISKGEFLGGRFAGALVINLIVLSGIGIGAALAGASPWVRPEKIAPFELAAYVAPYLSFVLPNLVLTAAIFFALVSLTRQMLPIYAGGVLLLIGYLMAGSLLTDIDNKRLAALIDPFGLRAHSITTQYWSVADRNTLYVPFDGVILWNRMIWLAIGLAILAIAYRRFRFAHAIDDRLVTPRPSRETEEISPQIDELSTHVFRARVQPAELPRVTQRFDAVARLTQFRSVMMRSFWRIVRNRSFAVIMIGALIFLGVASWKAGRMFGTPTWPVTYLMEELLSGTILVFIVVIIAVYAGELVWAERDVKGQQIADATPVPTWVLFLAKLTALSAMIALIMVIMIVAGMMIQAAKGYYRFEIPLYVQAMFGFRYLDWVLLAALAMTIHVFSNHKYVGHLLVILTVVGMQFLPLLGLERNFYRYGSDAGGTYSDMNGWGPFLVPFVWWKAYWLAFCALMLLATNLFWVRGEETRLAVRMRLARRRFDRPARVFAAAAGLSFVGVGSFLYYNTTHVNVFRASTETRRLAAEREKRYKKYQNAPQPRITAVNVRVDLEPRRQAVAVSGYFVLVNKTERPIDTVHISLSEEMKIRALTFDGDGERLVADSLRDYYMYRLPRSLGPGDSTVMRFELAHRTRGIPNEVENTAIVENGTFVPSEFFLPAIGYSERNELSDDGARRKEGLLPKRLRSPTDVSARANNYVSHDADWIRFEATVSTDGDQIAVAPGYLQREWTENGRRVFHYKMDAPILNFWAVLSARYAMKRDRWRDVDITIFYHPVHTYNLGRMIASVKKSLNYYTANFGPYQHHQVRILEFPRYVPFAQSLPNMIPYSEAVGFIARVEKPEDVDYPFYVTAHEVAHAWWAHQVVGADAQGATMLSETLAQYSALMVMEKEYGATNMRKFLAYELDSYLAQRAVERKHEMALQFVENQPNIHYNKGSLVMYALRDYIGEDKVNRTLRAFLDANKFRGPPYPTSLDLVNALRAATPDSLKYLIHDLFERITLYELRADSAAFTEAMGQPGKFRVDLWAHARKVRASGYGKESEVAMFDWIDIGVYASPPRGTSAQDPNGIPIYLAKQRVDSGPQHFTAVVDRRPSAAGIDPLHKLIDRVAGDNIVNVRDRTALTKHE